MSLYLQKHFRWNLKLVNILKPGFQKIMKL